jgi:hypothetical protein
LALALAAGGFERAAHPAQLADPGARHRDGPVGAQRRRGPAQIVEGAHDASGQPVGQADAHRQRQQDAGAVHGDALEEGGAQRGGRGVDHDRPAVARHAAVGGGDGVAFQRVGRAGAFQAVLAHELLQAAGDVFGDEAFLVDRTRHDVVVGVGHRDDGIGRRALALDHAQDAVGPDHGAEHVVAAVAVGHRHPHRHRGAAALAAGDTSGHRAVQAERLAQADRVGRLGRRFAERRIGAEQDHAVLVRQEHRQPFGLALGLQARQIVDGAHVAGQHGRALGQARQGSHRGVEFGVDGARQGARQVQHRAFLLAMPVFAGHVDAPDAEQGERQQADRGQQDQQVA